MDLPEQEKSALDTVEHELYDPKRNFEDASVRRAHTMRTRDLPKSWGEMTQVLTESEIPKGMSFGVKVLLGSGVVLLLALIFVAWRVISLRNVVSSANIDLVAEINPYIEGGEITPLVLTLRNRNTEAIEAATVTLSYKQGTGAQDEQEKVQEKRELGVVKAGEYKRQDFQVILYGSEAESRDISAKLEYKVAGSNALFSKVITTSVVLKTPPVAIHVEGPQVLSVGQSGTFLISVKNNTSTTSLPSMVQLTLPNSFTTESAEPRPSARGSLWAIPALDPGQSRTITLVGSIAGNQGETATIRALLGSPGTSVSTIGFVYSSQIFDVQLRSSPLTTTVMLDTERGATDSLRYGDKTTIHINYTNASDSVLQDVSFRLAVNGPAALYKQINPAGGYYDSTKQTITWDKTTTPELATLAPHAAGSLQLNIPIVLDGVNSPKLALTVTGVGTAVSAEDVVSTVTKSWVVQGSASLDARVAYKNSPFPNSGPIPPQANTSTTYAVQVAVSAQNALTNGRVSFILPAYVTWRGVTTDMTRISYDQKTRTVTWNVGNLDAGRDAIVSIGVAVRPSQSHVNQTPPITSGIVLDADEAISKAHIHMTVSPVTTELHDEAWPTDPSRVVD